MTPTLPGMDPAFVATTIEALPGRLQKRLGDAAPESWTIAGATITVGTATVTLAPPDGAECDCLLSPRCLHIAQVLTACPSMAVEPVESAEPAESAESTPEPLSLTDDQRVTVSLAQTCLMGLLDRGLGGLTAADRAAVLRIVSAGRVHHLPLLASAFARLHGELGNADGRTTEATISTLVDAALTTHRLQHGHETGTLSIKAVGTARRAYRPVGSLRLRGWACEPVVTASGYAGVITYLVDEHDGRVWQLSTVTPGDSALVRQAYWGGTELADLGMTHHDIVRSGVLINNATASADGRLGRGAKIRASARTPSEAAVPAEGWWVGDAVIEGLEDDGLHPVMVFHTEDGPLRCQVTLAAEQLGHLALRVMAGAVGVTVHLRLRARRPEEPGRSPWILISIGHESTWVFPGLDDPDVHWLGVPQDIAPTTVSMAQVDPATVLRRWRDAVARQGRRAVTGTNRERLMADAAWLRTHASGHRADLLEQLARAAAVDPHDVPRRWLAIAAVC